VGGARWEDFGQAPLEALADGALLATVPSGGPFEALRHARELAPELIGRDVSAVALADCIRGAFGLGETALRDYRERAGRRVAEYAPERISATIRDRLVPALLG
ncbi:MAG: hypothetical protein ABR581_09000, partial [Thermoleophilaceae bacterium]